MLALVVVAQSSDLSSYAVVAYSTVTSTGLSTVDGSIGLSPGTSVTGFPPAVQTGAIDAGNTAAANAIATVTTLYNALAALPCSPSNTNLVVDGATFTPGTYCFTGGMSLNAVLTLDGQGNASSLFVFQMATTLILATNAQINLIGGAQACGVFWQIGSSATLGSASVVSGTLVAYASISLGSTATSNGSLFARTGAVTMIASTLIKTQNCSQIKVPGYDPKSASMASAASLSALLVFVLAAAFATI